MSFFTARPWLIFALIAVVFATPCIFMLMNMNNNAGFWTTTLFVVLSGIAGYGAVRAIEILLKPKTPDEDA